MYRILSFALCYKCHIIYFGKVQLNNQYLIFLAHLIQEFIKNKASVISESHNNKIDNKYEQF